MNNELVKMVADKVGLPEDKATKAVETVLGYVKDKLPQPIASQVESLVAGGSSGSGGGIGNAIGDMFGGGRK